MEILLLETVHYYQKTHENRHMEAAICDCEIANYTRFHFSVEHHCFSFFFKIIFCLFLKKNKSGGRLYHFKKIRKSGKITPLLKSREQQSVGEQSKSAIVYHVLQNNHVISRDDAKVLQMESDASAWYIRESIWIRKRGTNVMNHDEGAYFLSHVYDLLLT